MRHNSYTNNNHSCGNNESSSSLLLLTSTSCCSTTTNTTTATNNDYYLPKLTKKLASSTPSQHHDLELWKQTEAIIKENLMQFDKARKFCAYCGLRETNSNCDGDESSSLNEHTTTTTILGRCYGCQMVYYCNQEHQHLDWLENHMPKCAELEWVALGELVQSIPIALPLPSFTMHWPENSTLNQIATWTDWFEIRQETVSLVRQIAKTLEKKFFSNGNTNNNSCLNKFNRREPTYSDLVDGLLAAVTDSMSYALTIGEALTKTSVNPSLKPICIHLLHPPQDILSDLLNLDVNNVEETVKSKFYELINMFPFNKGFEIVLISSNTIVDSLDWSKALQAPFMKTQLNNSLPMGKKNLYVSAWQGTYSHYIKYVCQIEGYAQPDLVVSFQPNFTKSPHKLIMDWTDDLKIIITNNFSCLFTFSDKDEKQKAFNVLNAFQTNFISVQSNQFSSLMLKQVPNKPNCVFAKSSFLIIIQGFKSDNENGNNHVNSEQIAGTINFKSLYLK